jgi:hypothetical protein
MRPARRERGDRGVWSPESGIRMVQDSEAPVESSAAHVVGERAVEITDVAAIAIAAGMRVADLGT